MTYWYYSWFSLHIGQGGVQTEVSSSSEFPLAAAMLKATEEMKSPVLILHWAQLTPKQFEDFKAYCTRHGYGKFGSKATRNLKVITDEN